MEIKEVAKEVANVLSEKVGFSIVVGEAVKPNGVVLTSLRFDNGGNVQPNFYLDDFDWRKKSPEVLANEILEVLKEEKISMVRRMPVDLKNYSIDDVFFKVFSARMFPYDDVTTFSMLDLVLAPYVLFSGGSEGIASIRVSHDVEEMMGICVADEFEKIKQNTIEKFPLKVTGLRELLESVATELPELSELPEGGFFPMMVLTNDVGINGATTALLTEAYERFSEDWESDVVVIPSSVHELICIPLVKEVEIEEISSMVTEVNRTAVLPEEILEDHPYVFRRDTGCLEVINV